MAIFSETKKYIPYIFRVPVFSSFHWKYCFVWCNIYNWKVLNLENLLSGKKFILRKWDATDISTLTTVYHFAFQLFYGGPIHRLNVKKTYAENKNPPSKLSLSDNLCRYMFIYTKRHFIWNWYEKPVFYNETRLVDF
jgi:hypothetical protein